METLFELLPDEMNLQILDFLTSPSDLLNIARSSVISHCLDWNFWKKKTFQIWKVPDWYFDLPIQQKREISGEDRFVEVASQFEVIPESVARIEDEKVKGVFKLKDAKFSAKIQGNIRMIKHLDLEESEVVRINQLNRFGLDHIINLHFLEGLAEKEFLEDTNKIFSYIEKGDTERVRNELEDKPFQTMACFAILGDVKMFDWTVRPFGFLSPKHQSAVIYFSMRANNFTLFEKLFSISNLSNKETRVLLNKAYYLAEKSYITFLENREIRISFDDKIAQLDNGYIAIPRPVEVYSILVELFSGERFIQGEVDARNLEKNPDFFLLLNSYRSQSKLVYVMEDTIQKSGMTIGLIRHCVSVLKEQGRLRTSKPFMLFSECEIKQAIFQEFGLKAKKIETIFTYHDFQPAWK